MKLNYLLLGTMLVLGLCITPVAAVSADDFEINITKSDEKHMFTGGSYWSIYTYSNVNNPNEEYIMINTTGTLHMFSYVTIKPANIPDAPLMVVDTGAGTLLLPAVVSIHLPRSVDEWEIKYYSRLLEYPTITDTYLKNAGVINLNKHFGKCIDHGLHLELSAGQWIHAMSNTLCYWYIPEV